MKKILYSAAAMALAFFAASCQQESLEPVGGNTVTYTVQVPDALSTKALGDEVTAVDTVYYEVYRAAEVEDLSKTPVYQGSEAVNSNGQASFDLEFVKNQEFVVLFWAQDADLVYDATDNPTGMYDIDDLRQIQLVNPGAANNAAAQVFAGKDEVSDCVSDVNGNVTLTRPVSQINVYTTTESLSFGDVDIELVTSSMTVSGLYNTYNVATGDAVEADENEATFAYTPAAVPTVAAYNSDLTYVAMNYVGFAPNNGTTVNVDFTIKTTETVEIGHSVSNVPLKPNFRTNITGNLITATADYNVSLNDNWGDAGKDMTVLADGLVKNINGDYEITSEVGLVYAINNFFAQGGDFYLTESLYDLSGFAVNPPTVPAGVTLNIYGYTPVVTRAALSGVVITGLDFGALIDEVAESASVSFANITLESNVPFVNENNGAVAFTDCANSNSNSNDESIRGLIAEGDGYVVDMTSIKDMPSLLEALGSGVKTINLSTTIKNTEEVVLDLKGATITGVDNNTSGNFYLINNIGKLTIKNTADKAATITLEAKNNRNWNSSSVVVANNPGGDLTIESGVVIEHLGGTDMAYGIDNLTNGKGTSTVTTINGATIKSTYTSARQFLNGVEATNELIVKGGSKLESTNRAIFFQDPSANPNTGKLVVEAGAELYGDVRLSVTAGSTEWPVIVSVAASALKDGEVTYQNVPEGYAVANVNGTWKVISDVAEVNGQLYTTLADAVDAAEDGSTITFLKDIEQVDGVLITDKNLTIDLNDKTFTVSDGANTNNRNFKINGSSVVTIKNGTMVANGTISTGAYGTVRTEDSANVTLNDVKSYSYRGYGLNVKACAGTTITISDSEIYTQYSGGVEAAGGTIILDNVKIDQRGVDSAGAWCSVAIGVNGGGKVTVNSGEYSAAPISTDANAAQGTWVAYVMSSGGTLEINGGTFNGTIAETAAAANACGIICADAKAVVEIHGGTFNSNGAILDMRNNTGATPNPVATLDGGVFSADPRVSGLYSSNLIKIAEGFQVVKNGNIWNVVAVQKNNEIWYTSDEMALEPTNPDALNAKVVSNVWDKTTGEGVITFDSELTSIGDNAFNRGSGNWVTTLSLPTSVKSIGNYAFYQWFSLTEIIIPDNVKSIGEYAFSSCDAVTTVTIGSGVTTIGSGAFYNCYEIKKIVCKATTPPALEDIWVFSGVSKADVKVIVPAASVDTYKADAFWSAFTNIVAE